MKKFLRSTLAIVLTLALFAGSSCMMAAVNNVITSIVPLYSRDKIDFTAGIILNKKTGDKVSKGELLATLYSNTNSFESAEKLFLKSTVIGNKKPKNKPLVLASVK